MAPLTPHWPQPSHPSIQKVIFTSSSPLDFTTKSISTITLPPFALYAKLSFPPCTPATEATYATVQTSKTEHINLNSDLVYINHSCDPSVIIDTSSNSILAGPHGLQAGQELTFFYPSTEWSMAQGFSCFCSSTNCKGYISGAKNMSVDQLEGMWLNVHIRELLEERDFGSKNGTSVSAKEKEVEGSLGGEGGDKTLEALNTFLIQARKMVDAAQKALDVYKSRHLHEHQGVTLNAKGAVRENGVGSRELSGEMGGDTSVDV